MAAIDQKEAFLWSMCCLLYTSFSCRPGDGYVTVSSGAYGDATAKLPLEYFSPTTLSLSLIHILPAKRPSPRARAGG